MLRPSRGTRTRRAAARRRAAGKLGSVAQQIADLRQAMLALIDGPGYTDATTGVTQFSYAHPLFWAPFVFVGD